MSSTKEPKSYREGMERIDTAGRGHLAEPLITINPKDIDAQTRIPSVIAMATHETLSAALTGEEEFATKENVKFKVNTASGLMALWEFSYEKKAISLDGKARQEYVDVSKLEAIGPSEDSSIAQSVLNEGAKVLNQKDQRKK